MQRNETLRIFNIQGNRLGDKIATALAEILRCNTTLLYLNADDNRLSLAGFLALEYALQRNRTLQKFEYPSGDLQRILRAGTMTPEKQNKLFSVLSNIQLAVNFNQQANGVHPLVQDQSYVEPQVNPLIVYSSDSGPNIISATQANQLAAQNQQQQQQQQQGQGGYSSSSNATGWSGTSSGYVVSDSISTYSQPSYEEIHHPSQQQSDYNYDSSSSQTFTSTASQGSLDGWGGSQPAAAVATTGAGGEDRTNDLYSALATVLGNDDSGW